MGVGVFGLQFEAVTCGVSGIAVPATQQGAHFGVRAGRFQGEWPAQGLEKARDWVCDWRSLLNPFP